VDDVWLVVASVGAGYLIGSFPTAVVVTRLVSRGKVDILAEGTHNPGGLNTAHVLGKGWGAVVIVIDILKGVVGALAGWVIGDTSGVYAGATAAIAGHIFPPWTRFRGGKGVATSGGAVLVVFPVVFPIMAAAAGLSVALLKNTERAVQITSVVWVGAAVLWWALSLPNLWGPEPTLALPVSQAAAVLIILAKFSAKRDEVRASEAIRRANPS
jgi:glycerol-3-phosphate acyltransferase PlsY